MKILDSIDAALSDDALEEINEIDVDVIIDARLSELKSELIGYFTGCRMVGNPKIARVISDWIFDFIDGKLLALRVQGSDELINNFVFDSQKMSDKRDEIINEIEIRIDSSPTNFYL